jgi:hypothetical protein
VSTGTDFAPAPTLNQNGGTNSGSVKVASAASALFGGFAASSPASAKASESAAQPVSLGIVFIGALLGAAMGALALLVRRGI